MSEQPTGGAHVRPGYGARLTFAMCAVIFLASLNIAAYAALLPELQTLWNLSNTQAGAIGSAYFVAYTIAVPFLTTKTDRFDPRLIVTVSLGILAAGALLFSIAAHGALSAALAHALMGVGFAGTYMPGLKALGDQVRPERLSRSSSAYTASFTLATAFAYPLAAGLSAALGWRSAFVAVACAALIGMIIVLFVLPRTTQVVTSRSGGLGSLLTATRNRSALAYSLAYGLHCWELFALRTWIVAFLALAAARGSSIADVLTPALVAGLLTLIGFVATLSGNELAIRIGRSKAIIWITLSSAMMCMIIGLSSAASYGVLAVLCLVHGMTVLGESATVTAGALGTAREGERGATMALHSTIGFAGAAIGPFAFGLILDVAGRGSTLSWLVAYGHLAIVIGLSALIIYVMKPSAVPGDKV